MRNLKKALALVLVFCMVLGTVASAASFSDVSTSYQYAEEVEFLADLGVLAGYPDGTFKTEGTITRVEAAAVIFRMLTGRTDASLYTGTTAFSDVAATYWGAGYINYCSNVGAISGYPDGTFLPDKNITVAEFESMLVRALGLAEGKTLSYPGGYIAIADGNGINDGVPSSVGNDTPANRGLVSKLAYNTICNATYATLATKDDEDPTILEKVFKINDYEVIIAAAGKYSVNNAIKDSSTNPAAPADKANKIGYLVSTGAATTAFNYIESAKASKDLLGTLAKVYVRTEGVDKGKAFAVVPTKKNNIVTLKNTEIYSRNAADDGKFYYKDANGGKVYFDITATTNCFTDYGTALTNGTDGIAQFQWVGDDASKDSMGKAVLQEITLVSNDDNDTTIEYVFAKTYAVGEYDGTYSDKMYFKTIENVGNAVAPTEIVLKDGNTVKNVDYPADLTKGDAVIVYKDGDYACVSPLETASGELTSIVGGGKYVIGGTTYKYALQPAGVNTLFTGTVPAAADIGTTFNMLIAPKFNHIVKTSEATASIPNYLYIVAGKVTTDYNKQTFKVQAYNTDGVKGEYILDTLTYNAAGTGFDADMQAIYERFFGTAVDTAVVSGAGAANTDVDTSAWVALNAATAKKSVLKVEIDSSNKIIKATVDGTETTPDQALTKDAYSESSKLLNYGANTVKVASNSVFFFDKKMDGETVKVYIGTVPAVSASNNIKAMYTKNTTSPYTVKAGIVSGEAKGATSSLENIPGVIISDYSIVAAAEADKYQVQVTMLTQGEKKTLKTTPVEKADATAIAGTVAKNALLSYDLTSDGLIAVADTASQTFTFVTGFTSDGIGAGVIPGVTCLVTGTQHGGDHSDCKRAIYADNKYVAGNAALVANGGVLATGTNVIGIGTSVRTGGAGTYANPTTINYYTLADDCVVYELDATTAGNGQVASFGVVRVIPGSDVNTATMKKAMLVFDKDDVADIAKAKVVAIYYFK